MAREFAGAWPYLELIAHSTGLADPLDRRVVEAYWVGSPRLDQVGVRAIGDSMEDRFRYRSGPQFGSLAEGVLAGGVPHHSFAVFCIYPWVGLLGDDRRAAQALTVLDRCRIRWGRVLAVSGDQVSVESRPLTWDGRRLDYGPPEVETVVRAIDGVGLVVCPVVRRLGRAALGVGLRPAHRAAGPPAQDLHRPAYGHRQPGRPARRDAGLTGRSQANRQVRSSDQVTSPRPLRAAVRAGGPAGALVRC